MLKMLPLLYEENSQDIIVRFRMCMLVSFTIDYLFETLLDVGQKETAIDNLLRCLVCDIQSQRAK